MENNKTVKSNQNNEDTYMSKKQYNKEPFRQANQTQRKILEKMEYYVKATTAKYAMLIN